MGGREEKFGVLFTGRSLLLVYLVQLLDEILYQQCIGWLISACISGRLNRHF